MLLLLVLFSGYVELTVSIRRPHIIFILGDDIGYNDVGWNNPRIHTPYMNQLARTGVILDNYYTFSVCSPSRASLLTGYYSHRLGMQRWILEASEPYGVPLNFKIIPKKLVENGYNAHAVGKWHIGNCDWNYTPTYRGFESWIGFYTGGEENYEHCSRYFLNRTRSGECNGFDFRKDTAVAHEYDGIYSGDIFTNRVIELINNHQPNDPPLMLYISLTGTHFPLQFPEKFRDYCSDSVNEARRNFCRTMAVIDEEVKNITLALKKKEMYSNSVIIFASDNGGATHFGGNNYPLRGEKGAIYEGGCRVPAFVHSPLLEQTGYVNKQLFHVTDWYPTILALAGVQNDAFMVDLENDMDGFNQWDVLSKNILSPRTSLPYLIDMLSNGVLLAAIRDERYKLIVGSGGTKNIIIPEMHTTDYSYNTSYFTASLGDPYYYPYDYSDTTIKLYDLQIDPQEKNDLASAMPRKVKEMLMLLEQYRKNFRPAHPIKADSRGDPENFNNTYSPGWCTPYYDTPMSYPSNELQN